MDADQAKRELIESQSAPRRLHRQKVTPTAASVPRPHSGGNIGLMKAVDKSNIAAAYKVLHLRNMVGFVRPCTRAIADQPATIRIPVHMIEDHQQAHPHFASIGAGTRPRSLPARNPSAWTFPCKSKGSQDAQEPILLEKTPIGEEEDSHLGDFIEDRTAVSPSESRPSASTSKEYTSQVLRTLTPREERVIKMRFGLRRRLPSDT